MKYAQSKRGMCKITIGLCLYGCSGLPGNNQCNAINGPKLRKKHRVVAHGNTKLQELCCIGGMNQLITHQCGCRPLLQKIEMPNLTLLLQLPCNIILWFLVIMIMKSVA